MRWNSRDRKTSGENICAEGLDAWWQHNSIARRPQIGRLRARPAPQNVQVEKDERPARSG
jgi:hypothetical protein